jgi:hypothetical protein
MQFCCPPDHGCNTTGRAEKCALEVCAAAPDNADAALALDRWSRLEKAAGADRRFRRRAYQRARDRALIALALAPRAQRRTVKPARRRMRHVSKAGLR